jgi:hypothetical protein
MDELAFHYDGFKFHTPSIKYKYKENMKLKLKTFQFALIMFQKVLEGTLNFERACPSRFKEATKSKEKREWYSLSKFYSIIGNYG